MFSLLFYFNYKGIVSLYYVRGLVDFLFWKLTLNHIRPGGLVYDPLFVVLFLFMIKHGGGAQPLPLQG